MNALLGEKISITTSKPQTTRKSILGILSGEDHQVIFLDTPGILNPKYLLQEKMMEHVIASVEDSDVVLVIIDISEDPEGKAALNDDAVKEVLDKSKRPKILVINKVDLSNDIKVKNLISVLEKKEIFTKIIPVSATLGFNILSVKDAILEYIPEHPKYFPDDILSNENERFFTAEIIREKILGFYKEEIPYSCEVVVEEFREKPEEKDYILANIYVERDSQKKIIIGKEGSAIKKVGSAARRDIESFLGREIFLELRVKTKENWRSSEQMMKYFGYSKPKE
jgi:GTP-binding protein Era